MPDPERPIRVVHVLGSFGCGGAESGVVRLVEKLGDPFSHAIVSLSEDLAMAGRLPPWVPCTAVPRKEKDRLLFLRLARLFREREADIVHANNLGTWFDAAVGARLAGCKSIMTFHGVEDPSAGLGAAKICQAWLSWGLGHGVTAVSSTAADLFSRLTRIPKSRVQTIANGVDTSVFCPGSGNQKIRTELGLPPDLPLIGCVAALRPVKDHRGLIRSFAQILNHGVQACLVLVGDGPEKEPIDSLVQDLGIQDRVVMVGQVDNPARWLSVFDLFMLNSVTEGMSYALMEAMASGLPAVVTKVGGNPVLVDHGRTGLMVDVGDIGGMASAAAGLLEDHDARIRMGKAARQAMVDAFSLENMLKEYRLLYRGLLS